MPQWLTDLWQFLTSQKDPIETLLKVLGFLFGSGVLVALGRGLYSLYLRWRRARLPAEPKAFEIITDPAALLPRLYNEENDPDPLAHHRIPYQRRVPDRDLQGELHHVLNTTTRYLLLTAPTGYGKTREAATLARSLMMAEEYRLVRVLKSPWLNAPKEFPPQLKDDRRRILILLDDLNGFFRVGSQTQPPRAEEGPMPGLPPVHDRLLRVLDYFEKACGEQEIRVLATARDEESKWRVLDFDPRDALWRRFTRVELGPPRDSAIVELMEESVARANLPAEEAEFDAIARTNDGTFKNVVLNLRRLRGEGRPLTRDNYTATLRGSWDQVYEHAAHKHEAVPYIYDAISALREAQIELYPWLVEPAARMLWGGNPWQRPWRRRALRRALRYLVNERILPMEARGGALQPHEGQIEAKGAPPDWEPHAPTLHRLVLRLAGSRGTAMLESLLGFGTTLYEARQFERAAALWQKGTELGPQAAVFWSNLGVAFAGLERPAEAEAAYRQAIARDPNYAKAYSNLGTLLDDMERPAEAEAAFRQAIARDPNYAKAYYNLGTLLARLERPAEAEAAYRQAIARDPNLAQAYSNLGLLLHEKLERPAEAEAAHRQAIARDPNDATAYSNLGLLLHEKLERPAEAEAAYRQAIARDPNLAQAYSNLGILLRKMNRYDEAEKAYRQGLEINPHDTDILNNLVLFLRLQHRERDALPLLNKLVALGPKEKEILLTLAGFYRQLGDAAATAKYAAEARHLIPADDWYNLACLESICGHTDAALEHLQRAAQAKDFDPDWAWRDPDLEWIRGDPRFAGIVPTPPPRTGGGDGLAPVRGRQS